jgi:hypothetical protein
MMPSHLFRSFPYSSGPRQAADERNWIRSDVDRNDPKITHQVVHAGTERHGHAPTERLYLDPDESLASTVVRDDINSARVACGRHHVPSKQRESIANVIKTGIASDVRMQFSSRHLITPHNGRAAQAYVGAAR